MIWTKVCAWLVALEFFLKQNQYFGWNLRPASDADLIADGITLVLIALAIGISAYEPARTRIVFRDRGVVISSTME